MNLLKKVISLRESSGSDHEKPFLEHLEDLRKMIFRIVITLVISMILCFAFQKQLMDVLRRPVDVVWQQQQEKKLPQKKEDAPRPVSVDDWNQAKKIEKAASRLTAVDRDAFYQSLADRELVFHARCVALLRAAKALPEDKQKDFIRQLKISQEMREQLLALNQLEPGTEIDGRGNLKLMSALKPTETFMLSMKLSFIAGIVLAFPLLLVYILQFVLPGLHPNERRALWPAMGIGFGLFLSGVFFAYFVVLPRALTFFYEWAGGLDVTNEWRIGWYISFATNFTLLFGVAFELPVVVMFFVKLGLLSYDTMSRTRRYAIVGIFVLAAVLTPTPDVMTLSLMAAPMIILYEICIWLAFLDRKKQRQLEAEREKERQEWAARRAAEKREADADRAGEDTEDPDPYGDYDDSHYEYGDDGDYPDDYDWDKEYEQFHEDAGLDEGEEEQEEALDAECDADAAKPDSNADSSDSSDSDAGKDASGDDDPEDESPRNKTDPS